MNSRLLYSAEKYFSASEREFLAPLRGEAEQISAGISVRCELDGIFAYHNYFTSVEPGGGGSL